LTLGYAETLCEQKSISSAETCKKFIPIMKKLFENIQKTILIDKIFKDFVKMKDAAQTLGIGNITSHKDLDDLETAVKEL
jgi:hypothetical protein